MVDLPQRVLLEAGHLADHNALHTLLDGFEDNVGNGEINFNAQYSPINTSSGDDTVLLQTALDAMDNNNWLRLSGSYGISAPLILQSGRRLRGPAQIYALAGFDFSQTVNDGGSAQGYGVAMLMERNATIFALGKLYIEDITLEGVRRTGSRGFLGSLQQPGYFNKFRINNCLDYGMRIRGQQHVFVNTEIIEANQALVFDDASFMWFFGFNAERNLQAAVTDTRDGTAGGLNNQFYGIHLELGNATPDWDGAKGFWLTNTEQTKIFGLRTSQRATQTFFHADRFAGTRPLSYSIFGAYTSTATNTNIAIEDVDRGLTAGNELLWWDDFRGSITELHAPQVPTSQSFPDPHPILILGTDGRKLGYGGTRNTVPTMDFTPATAQTAAQTVWRDSAGVQRFSVGRAGNPILPSYDNTTRTAIQSVLVAGATIWNTSDNAPNFWDGTNWRDAAGIVT